MEFAVLGALFLLSAIFVHWDARKKQERALDEVREATDKYRDAIHIRQEAYRLIALTLRFQEQRNAGFEEGRAACISKLQEVSKYYATRPEAEAIAGHLDEMAILLRNLV